MNNKRKALEDLLKEKIISQRTYDKAKIAKEIIERKYNLKNVENAELNYIIEKINSLDLNEEDKEKIKKEIFMQQSSKYRFSREKQTIRDYESLAIIGRGAFGEVHVCRQKTTGEIVAIKKIKKEELFSKNQVIHVRNEQLFMSKVKSPWIVDLKASFQDEEYLYLVMEYLPGGDLMNLLIQKDILTEEEARFYIAELILSIESIHKLDCIHRDIKPDNILIDKNGHIKLSDFGLAKISEKLFEQKNNNNIIIKNYNENENDIKKHQKNYSCVGTAYYVAPEVLNKKGYGKEIDWWSVGVIFFEMLFGYAPFCSKETSEVCHKILNWEKYLKIPAKIKISREAEDLIAKLINNSDKRLGLNGAEEIKAHPFFKDFDWNNITNITAPFIPELKNEYDTHYFDKYEIKEPFYPNIKKKKKRKDIEYLGYTYKDDPKNNIDIFKDFQNAIQKLKKEKKNMNLTPNETFIDTHSQTKTSSNKLNEKINLNKTNININNIKIKNCLETNCNTEPNNKKMNEFEKICLLNKAINYKYNNIDYKNGKSTDKNEVKLNIIQLPNKKITKKNDNGNKKFINNKLITINNVVKKNNNNCKNISIDKMKNKSLKKNNKNNISIFNSILRPKGIKISPSPNQKNIFLMKLIDKSKSRQKTIRAISGDNTRNKKYNLNNSMKKPINQNKLKKIIGKKKNTSLNKGNNNLIKKLGGNILIYNNNNQKNNKKNINLINIGNKTITNKSERNSSPSTKLTYICKKKKE